MQTGSTSAAPANTPAANGHQLTQSTEATNTVTGVETSAATAPVAAAMKENDRTVLLKKPVILGEGAGQLKLDKVVFPDPETFPAGKVLYILETAHGEGRSVNVSVLALITKMPYALVEKVGMTDMRNLHPHLQEFTGN